MTRSTRIINGKRVPAYVGAPPRMRASDGDCLRHRAFAPSGSSLLRSLAGSRFNPYRKGGFQ